MDKKIIVCEKCKRDSDTILFTPLVGDEKVINPNIKPVYSQYKCERCGRILLANEKMFVVTPFPKTFRCPHCNQEYPCYDLSEAELGHIKNCPKQFSDPQEQFNARQKLHKRKG